MGLREGDLHDLVKPVFEVDSYKSKMGDDADICVVSFSVIEHQAAKDLVDFIEKGYNFVLDADATPGEIDNGMYKVFVEMERDRKVNDNIMELLDGVGKLSRIDEFKFRYYKSFRSRAANIGNLQEMVPIDPRSYDLVVQESRIDNFKDFFTNSFVDKIEMFENNLLIKKIYADPIVFNVKDFDETNNINTRLDEKINMDGYAEIMFLTKYLGDYNITKFGKNTFTLENKGYTLVLERVI